RKTMPDPRIAATRVQRLVDLKLASASRRPSYNPRSVTRPRIALTLSRPDPDRLPAHTRYTDALERAGADVFALYPGDPIPADIDGLLLSGGTDIAPDRYGAEDVACRDIDLARDELELAAARAALE